jgi:hypothetical protein
LKEEVMERARDGEDQVEVGNRQEIQSPRLLPSDPLQSLALGTVPVPTGVVRDLLVPAAVVALPEMATQRRGAATLDRGDGPALLRAKTAQPVAVETKDVRQLRATGLGRPGAHGQAAGSSTLSTSGSRSSSGLTVSRI